MACVCTFCLSVYFGACQASWGCGVAVPPGALVGIHGLRRSNTRCSRHPLSAPEPQIRRATNDDSGRQDRPHRPYNTVPQHQTTALTTSQWSAPPPQHNPRGPQEGTGRSEGCH